MSCNILMLGENQTYVLDGSVQPSLSYAYTLCWQNCVYIGRPMPRNLVSNTLLTFTTFANW